MYFVQKRRNDTSDTDVGRAKGDWSVIPLVAGKAALPGVIT